MFNFLKYKVFFEEKMFLKFSNSVLLVALLGPLVPPPVELGLVHSPDSSLHVLHATEALVEGEVVADSVLKTSITAQTFLENK